MTARYPLRSTRTSSEFTRLAGNLEGDKENPSVQCRTKQSLGGVGVGKPVLGGRLVGRPPLALGNARNNVNRNKPVNTITGPDGQKKIVEFGAVKKVSQQSCGAQNQSRIVKKPESRPPIRRTISGNNNITTNAATALISKSGVPSRVSQSLLATTNASFGIGSGMGATTHPPLAEAKKYLTRAELRKSTQESLEKVTDIQAKNDQEPVVSETMASEEKMIFDSEVVTEDKEPGGSYSTAMIPNIDDGDEYDPQLAADYVNDIYQYLRYLEREQSVNEDYLRGNGVLTGKMRGILVDWLVQVHIRFKLLPETLYMTVMLIDRFLQTTKKVEKDKLQLVGVAAMFLASKYEEIYAPEIGDFEYITDHSYTCQQIRLMEIEILKTLKFDIGRPLPLHFLRRFSKAAEADADLHSMAKYLMELSLVEYSMTHFLPSVLAASSLWLALKLMEDEKWSSTLIHYTRYKEEDLMPCVRRLCRLLIKTHTDKTKHQAVRNKFGTTKFRCISTQVLDLDKVKAISETYH